MRWARPLVLNSDRSVRQGSTKALADAIRRGADLRIGTQFRHNEHVDPTSDDSELVREVCDFRITYLLDDHWTAGIINLRQPVNVPDGFGPRESMSFFLYNQNGQQAVARPYLDGKSLGGSSESSLPDGENYSPKYHQQDMWDVQTNAPSSNFIYDFDVFEYMVLDEWQEVFANTANGDVLSGSLDDLTDAFSGGCEVKVAIRGLCTDLAETEAGAIEHEVFVHGGSCYYCTEQKLFLTGTHPVVRVRPGIPLLYFSRAWDFGWLMPRTDGFVARWLCDPYTLKFQKSHARHDIRWFVR